MGLRVWYPEVTLSKQYVYLNTLRTDNPSMYVQAQNMLRMRTYLTDDNNKRMMDAVNFLLKIADAEEGRELAFMEERGVLGIEDLTSGQFTEYVEKINSAITSVQRYQTRIRLEEERWGKKGTGAWSYTQATGSYISRALNALQKEEDKSNSKSQRKNNKNDDVTVISRYAETIIAKAVKEKMSGKNYSIDEIAAVIGTAVTLTMEDLQTNDSEIFGIKLKDASHEEKLAVLRIIKENNFLNMLMNNDNAFAQLAKGAIEEVLPSFRITDKSKQEEIRKKYSNEKERSKMSSRIVNITEGLDERIANAVIEARGTNERFYNFKRNTGIGGEMRAFIDTFKKGIARSWTGSKHGKSDMVLYLGDIVRNNKENKDYRNKISDAITAQTQSAFTEVGQVFSNYYRGLDENGNQLIEDLEALKNSFIIHESVKDYVTTNNLSSSYSGFHGFESGSWKGGDLINAIVGMASVAGEQIDKNMIANVLLNLTPAAVGEENMEHFKRYLAMFIVMLSFDDGYTMVEQAMKDIPKTTTNVIHLFNLNGIYVPSSAVLRLIANSFRTIVEDTSDLDDFANISIGTGNLNFREYIDTLVDDDGKPKYGYKRWDSVASEQMKQITVTIKMLNNFRDIVTAL